ncbi:glycosyltransferase family 2 protein [Acetatifactor muris]|uniref:Glycosyltransferase CsbB n=1 Tax=Acetatifactor muris TaxID=879566 RepID=A0A2K4ZFC7_9FIRM|nr:glycosyltransferase family 2 protein [Acetatifactor muris]MCI8800198.1 glycosyltransferase family 2 protein [Lachnospiraceae bacterium]MCR2047357.1 glycosyltransferase family 2 protein [Acetatifactor muris]SOY29162.1 Putative glycosyltransferase CsbB [Acetatifactor muris]
MALLSIVLPAYNEEQNIANTSKVLSELLEEQHIEYELVYVSDGSRDGTFSEIQKAAAGNPRIRGVEFSRNFGKEAAIFAGLELTVGNAAIVMDCDLQHPPQVIPRMWELWKDGAEVVEGIKESRGKESLAHRLSAGLFYKVMSGLIKMDMNASSDFKLLDRKVVDVLLTLPERNTFFRALSFWVGFRTEKVTYEVQERQFGESKWSFFSLMKYAVTNATSFSTLPLQLVTVMGIVSILFSIILFIQTLVKYLMGTSVEGFTTVILLILIIGGFLMLSLGIIGHYIARIYEEVKGRPKYIISKRTDEH